MRNQFKDRFPVSSTQGIPQPWERTEMNEEQFMASAIEQEAQGKRLAVLTWVNGYPDPLDDGDLWLVDWFDYSDWRTGEPILAFNPNEVDPDSVGELDGIFVVEQRVAEVA